MSRRTLWGCGKDTSTRLVLYSLVMLDPIWVRVSTWVEMKEGDELPDWGGGGKEIRGDCGSRDCWVIVAIDWWWLFCHLVLFDE